MSFDPDEIARLSPAVRVEVQDYYARKFLADRNTPQPERRSSRGVTARPATEPGAPAVRPAWPRVWFRNDSSRSTSSQQAPASPPSREDGRIAGVALSVPFLVRLAREVWLTLQVTCS